MKLPKAVEADPRHAELKVLLGRDRKPLWESGPETFAHVPFSSKLGDALQASFNFKHVVFGLEQIEGVLRNEKRGIDAVRAKQAPVPARVSRLLVVTNDGSERFYRSCEKLAVTHADRMILLVVGATSFELASRIFGQEREIKALFVSDKEAAARVLLSLV